MADSTFRLKYSGLDFNTHFDDLLARMQVEFAAEYSDYVATGLGIVLIDLISFGLDTLSFYLDRRVTDTFMETARTRKSVTRLARQLGYKVRSAVAASTTLQVSLKNGPYAFPVPIYKGFQFLGPNDLIFEAGEDVIIPAGTASGVPFDVPVYEGRTFNETFASDGSPVQEFQLRRVPTGMFMASGASGSPTAVVAKVNAVPWTEADFIEFEKTNQFEVEYTNEPPVLRFGDAVAGNIPPTGASIQIQYVATSGTAGKVQSGTITAVKNPLVVMFTTIPLNVNNATPATGGDDPETLASVKVNAPKVYKTRKVAVTASDYESLSQAYSDPLYGAVAIAKAISSRSAEADLFLRTELLNITAAVASPVSTVDSAVSDGTDLLDTIDDELTSISDDLSSIAAKTTSADSDLTSAINTARTSRNKTQEIDSGCSDIATEVVSGKAAIDAIPDLGGPDTLSAATKNTLKTFYTSINTEATGILGASATISSNIATELSLMDQVQNDLADVGLTTADGLLKDLDTSRANIAAAAGSIGPPTTGLRKVLDDIYVAIVSGALSMQESIAESTTAIFDHVDRILSADCKANLVTVPILTLDAGGFFAAPSVGLIRSLKDYLDARKEVTQNVEVVSGEDFLVAATLRIRLAILPGYSVNLVRANAESVIDNVLRGRAFGASLYVSEVYDALRQQVAGLSFVNVFIEDPSTKLDVDGNLIIAATEVITKGTVTIETEVVTGAA